MSRTTARAQRDLKGRHGASRDGGVTKGMGGATRGWNAGTGCSVHGDGSAKKAASATSSKMSTAINPRAGWRLECVWTHSLVDEPFQNCGDHRPA